MPHDPTPIPPSNTAQRVAVLWADALNEPRPYPVADEELSDDPRMQQFAADIAATVREVNARTPAPPPAVGTFDAWWGAVSARLTGDPLPSEFTLTAELADEGFALANTDAEQVTAAALDAVCRHALYSRLQAPQRPEAGAVGHRPGWPFGDTNDALSHPITPASLAARSAALLATAVSPHEALLRVCLPADGRGTWALFRSDGRRLRVAGSHRAGRTDVRRVVLLSVLRHGLAVAWAALSHVARQVVCLLAAVLPDSGRRSDLSAAVRRVEDAAAAEWLRELDAAAGAVVADHPADDAGESEPHRWALAVLADFSRAPDAGARWLAAEADGLADAVGRVLELDALAPLLADRPHVSVVGGPLVHALPLGLLPVAGKPLAEWSASVRVGVSPLFERLPAAAAAEVFGTM